MKNRSTQEILSELYLRVREIPSADAAHDFSHFERVILVTCDIYQKEMFSRHKKKLNETELLVPEIAALLHDCVPIPKNSPLRKESSRLASEKARQWLVELGWEKHAAEIGELASIDEICKAIEDHSYSASLASGRSPRNLLGECLQDADRLEALGAIGLYRVIATGVAMGAQFFDPEDPWADDRLLDDRKYTVDHFFTKLLKLPQTFRTATARTEAVKRADFLKGFLDQLKREISV